MKGKLIKEDEEYYLEDNLGVTIASTDKILLKETDTVKKLSLKNCQAIENGYDLDDKISKHLEKNDIEASAKRVQVIRELILEILGDKKFSEEDMRKMYDISCGKIGLSLAHDQTENNERFRLHLRSIKQTEWDVEIEMEEKWIAGTSTYGHGEYELKPKLDADGCLILKKV